MNKKQPARKPGPKEDRLKLSGDWREAAKKAIQKKPPKRWPDKPKQ